MTRRMQKFTHPFLTLVAAFFLGCSNEPQPERIPTYPVTGSLHIDGQPAAGTMIKFYDPQNRGRMPAATVRADGTFSASFYTSEDGAPTGEYQLLVLWMTPPPGGGLPVDRLQGRFADPARSVRTINVIAGENRLEPIDLDSTKPSTH